MSLKNCEIGVTKNELIKPIIMKTDYDIIIIGGGYHAWKNDYKVWEVMPCMRHPYQKNEYSLRERLIQINKVVLKERFAWQNI